MTPLDNLRRIVAGWRGEWRVDAHEGITLSHDGDEWPIGALDGDAVIMLVELLNAIRPAVDGATAEIERLTAELAAANTLIASYESPTCDHRHPCRCGSGGHPRRCERHPNAYDRHIVELNAIGKTEAEREAVEVRICTIADEAFGPFPVQSTEESLTAIEQGIASLRRELAAARAVPPDVEAAIDRHGLAAFEAGNPFGWETRGGDSDLDLEELEAHADALDRRGYIAVAASESSGPTCAYVDTGPPDREHGGDGDDPIQVADGAPVFIAAAVAALNALPLLISKVRDSEEKLAQLTYAKADVTRLTAEIAEAGKLNSAINNALGEEGVPGRMIVSEVARVVAELAAARAVPPDVEAAIKSTVDGAEEAGRCSALGHAYLITKAPFWTVPHLKAAIARAIADATASKSATVGIAAAIKSVERIESTSKALGYSADYMAAIDRVLSCLRAVAENGGPLASTVDGGAGKPATVGGLLATAPVGSIVECVLAGAPCQVRMYTDDGEEWCEFRKWFNGGWREWAHGLAPMRTPARLVPAHLTDADPASRGPIGEG